MVRKILFIALFCTVCNSAYSQTIRAYAGDFLQLGAGARSLALGGAAIGFVEDATAGYWNPASLVALQYPSIVGMHDARFDNTVKYDYGAIAIPLGKTAAASLSIFHIGVSDIKDTRNAFINVSGSGTFDGDNYLDYTKVKTFGNYDWGIYLSYAQRRDSQLSYGVSLKFIARKLDEQNSATGIGFDASIKYKATENLYLAAVANDITTTLLAYTTGTRELVAPMLKLGAAYMVDVASNTTHILMPVADIDLRFENRKVTSEAYLGPISADVHLGLEYTFKQTVSIRGGFSENKQFTLGAGIHLPKLTLDYAFQSFNAQDQLGNTHRISFAFSLEQDRFRRAQ